MAEATIQAPSQPTARRFSSSTTTRPLSGSFPESCVEPEIRARPTRQMEPTRPTALCDPVTAARGSFASLGATRGTPMDPADETSGSATLRSVGIWSATVNACLAAVAFGVAATTPPRTGPFAAPGTAVPIRTRRRPDSSRGTSSGCISHSR